MQKIERDRVDKLSALQHRVHQSVQSEDAVRGSNMSPMKTPEWSFLEA